MTDRDSGSPADTIELFDWLTRRIGRDGRETLTYLGYPLRLSPDEARLLHVLQKADPSEADAQGYLPVDTVLAGMRAAVERPLGEEERLAIFFDGSYVPPALPYSPAQIANIAQRVNRKAAAIGGRRLILGKSHHGYKINPYM